MNDLITAVSSLVTAAVGWVGDFAGAITSNDILVLTCVAVPLAGFGIGALARLMRRKA